MYMAAKLKLSAEDVKAMNLFENFSGIEALDCIKFEGELYFLVSENKAGLAIGKNGRNVKKLYEVLGKKINVLEYCPVLEKFLRRYLNGKITSIEMKSENGKKVAKILADKKDRGKIFGRGKKNLKIIGFIAKRHFNIDEVRVV